MPVHDWTRVPAGLFHDFHHEWISAVARSLNDGILPANHYSLVERIGRDLGRNLLALPESDSDAGDIAKSKAAAPTATLSRPKLAPAAQFEIDRYRRKQKSVTIRHVSDDDIVAVIEIVSPGNKAAARPLRALVGNSVQLLDRGIHLMVVDVLPPGRRDPQGVHAEIWGEIAGEDFQLDAERPLTQASYEAGDLVRAYVAATALGGELPTMPLFLESDGCVEVSLEATYGTAFDAVPRRWRERLEAT